MSMYTESLRAFLKPVLPFLDDDTVTEILINGPRDVWVERQGRLFRTEAKFSEEGLLGAARNIAQFVGRILSDERPRLDARLPDGSRIHVVLPPIARQGVILSIRKFFKDRLGMEDLMRFGTLSLQMGRIIDVAVQMKLNTVVAGGTGSGKTTLLNVISQLISAEERILTIEDSAELQLSQAHLVSLESRPPDKHGKGGVDMGDLLQSALRLRPDRIIVGEVRGGECFHLMQALNTGHGGSLTTCHANSPLDTLRRLETLCLMSAVDLPLVAVRAQVASAIHVIICCERFPDGSRKVSHISEVLPLNERGEHRTQDLWVYTPVGKDAEGNAIGYYGPTGILPSWLGRAHAHGFVDLDERYFDPATYGLPPPPVCQVGHKYELRWAPSLKHREEGLADPPSFAEEGAAFEAKLRAEPREAVAPVPEDSTLSPPRRPPPPPRAVARPPLPPPRRPLLRPEDFPINPVPEKPKQ